MGKKLTYTLSTIAVLAVIAGAVALLHKPSANTKPKADAKIGDFKVTYTNKAKPIKDGTLKIGLAQAFTGVFAPELVTQQVDSLIAQPLGTGLLKNNSSYQVVDGGAANFKLDKATKTATITLHKGLTWSDGKPVIAKDLEFAYEIVGNLAYGGITYTDSLENIKGMAAFHKGRAKSISGITYPDGENGNSIKLAFNKLSPGLTQAGSGDYLSTAEPYHYLKDIKPAKLAGSKQIRQAPLSWGPFKVEKVLTGQNITYVRNPYYYAAKAKLAKIDLQVVASSSIVEGLKTKQYDIAYQVPTTSYPAVKKLPDYVQTGRQSLSFSATYFNLGHFDAKQGVNVQDRKTILQNKSIRQALGYALNTDQVNKKFNNGLQTFANSTVPPVYSGYNDKAVKGFPLDIKKANAILDKAGFKWDAKHEYRLNPDGKPFSLTYLAQNAGAISTTLAQNNLQQWKSVGLNVHLYKNRLIDFNSWVQKVTTNSNDWDITNATWSLNPDPSQSDLFSASAQYNLGHYVSPELTKIINNIDSEKSLDTTYRKAQFAAYQQYIQDEAVVIPQSFSISWTPINRRVIGWSKDVGVYNMYGNLAVSADSPE
ncbi:oligopeptide ABC transporter substrate-binding protein [Periweissella cryptocerci]|uniref:Oligopeptide ABC transporter substrate-binding protein n=1 Tax=Periweissella cryptocerci TaxID=2506420 RepID=A0A4P6YRG4_9LACO|nr:ABC transporter substrate-binding protein [Periweissella cryptocerci]QBO35206.1 oligopeptide ABC transporter substrate-binding protein [Periweissella cryptocerci]